MTPFEALAIAQQFFVDCLAHETIGRPAREYLRPRAHPATWADYRLGYAPRGFAKRLRPVLDDATMVDLGLLDDRGNEAMADRVTFPWLSMLGDKVLGLGGRRIIDAPIPKYANGPDRDWFSKGRVVFGLHQALPYIQATNAAVIVEGPFDAMAMWEQGRRNTVATVGAKITLTQLSLVAVLCDHTTVLLDGDEGGRRGLETLAAHLDHDDLLPTSVVVSAGRLPADKDPAECTFDEIDAALHQALPLQRSRKYLHSQQ